MIYLLSDALLDILFILFKIILYVEILEAIPRHEGGKATI